LNLEPHPSNVSENLVTTVAILGTETRFWS
jgi:hypothetical protein